MMSTLFCILRDFGVLQYGRNEGMKYNSNNLNVLKRVVLKNIVHLW
jgi:hypothetical protein